MGSFGTGSGFGGSGAYDERAGSSSGRDFKRIMLAIATSGTSEIKTGGGQYGDETIADSLFPKGVNDAMLDDRQVARRGVDATAVAQANQAAGLAVAKDRTDALLSGQNKAAALRLLSAQGRKSSFITGPLDIGSGMAPLSGG